MRPGINIYVPISTVYLDPELWGADAREFDPGRFADVRRPHVYLPFGVSVCTLPWQAFVMAELKVAGACAVQVPAQPVARPTCTCRRSGSSWRRSTRGAPTQEHGAQGLMPLVILWAGWMPGPRSFLPLSQNREFQPNR
jgi:hypothetical protein